MEIVPSRMRERGDSENVVMSEGKKNHRQAEKMSPPFSSYDVSSQVGLFLSCRKKITKLSKIVRSRWNAQPAEVFGGKSAQGYFVGD